MQAELRSWLIRAGFPEDVELTAMHRGLGSTEMWSFVPAPEAPALVVRVFGEGAGAAAEREYLAMDAAARHGLPVPAIVMRGAVLQRPLLVTTFIPGVPASQALEAHRERAHALGMLMGQMLGRVHEVAAPVGLSGKADAWIDRGGSALVPVRGLLEAMPRQDRLLHLDYHLFNVLLHEGRVAGVIDWENTIAGPPHMDLARTRAILRAAVLGGHVPAQWHEAVAHFERGLVAGHAEVMGDDPFPELSAVWGLAMTVDDLTSQAGKPGSPIMPALIEQLAEEWAALIRSIMADDLMHQR